MSSAPPLLPPEPGPWAAPASEDRRERARLRRELAQSQRALARMEAKLNALRGSLSWKWTHPLRIALARWRSSPQSAVDAAQRLLRDDACGAAPAHPGTQRLLLVDTTELSVEDLQGGIQRVVKSILFELLLAPPAGWCVVPVRLTHGGRYVGSSDVIAPMLGFEEDAWAGRRVETAPGDVFLGLDLVRDHAAPFARALQSFRASGVAIWVIVYDLLPLDLPTCFPPNVPGRFAEWLEAAANNADGLACISATVAARVQRWLEHRPAAPQVVHFLLGAEVSVGSPRAERGRDALRVLMVGTIEPRKRYDEALDAFERLWSGPALADAELVIAGRPGWASPALLARLEGHRELGRRLHWLRDATDAAVEREYAVADLLLSCSIGEGFGLPLLEAASHGVSLLLRDLPEFREVAGADAMYFGGEGQPATIDRALRQWREAPRGQRTAPPPGMRDWARAAADMLHAIGLDAMAQHKRSVSWEQ